MTAGSAERFPLSWDRVRRAVDTLTTPLLPDDYLNLVNPLWTSRELRGRVEEVVPETEDAVTLVIRPGWGWRFDHHPGQYVGIGVQVDGRWQWRSYSVSSSPLSSYKWGTGRTIAITVRAMPEGFISSHLVGGLAPGTIVRLALPDGDFVLPDPPPERLLFLVGGSGVTPVMAMLRTLDRRGSMPDVVLHYSSPTRERMIFREEIERLEDKHERLAVHQLYTDSQGMLALADLDDLCPDWRERETYACGPSPMLDAIVAHFEDAGLEERLHLERFTIALGGDGGEGGTITFRNTGRSVESDGATTVLEAGEQAGVGMPFGCRMASATPARSRSSPARCATCATATSSTSRTNRCRPASPPRSATARSTSRETRWPSPTSRSTCTSATRRSSSSAASWTRSGRRSRSPGALLMRRTSTGSSGSSATWRWPAACR